MDIGGLLAGAGRVGVGMREEQEARRVAAANQVALERLRRQEQAALDFSRRAQVTPVQVGQLPTLDQQFRFPLGAAAPVAPTITAPAARTGSAPTPAPAPAPTATPTTTPTPTPAAAAPTPTAAPTGTKPVAFGQLPVYTDPSRQPAGSMAGLIANMIPSMDTLTGVERRIDPVTGDPVTLGEYLRLQDKRSAEAARVSQPKPAPTTQPPAGQRQPSPAAPTKKQLDDAPQVSELATQLKPGDLYRADPQAITFDMQQFQQQQQLLVQQRNELAQLANMYLQMATPESIAQFTNLKTAINQLDIQNLQLNANAMYLQGAQGIRELELANDPRRLQAVMSQYAGVPIGLQPNQDGSYNMYVNGQLNERARNINPGNLVNYAQLLFDESAREALKQNAAAESKLAMEAKYGIKRDVAKVVAETSKAIQTALVEGTIRERITQIEAQSKGKVSFSPEGLIVYNAPDGMVYEISPERIDAKTGIRTPTSAKPVLFR